MSRESHSTSQPQSPRGGAAWREAAAAAFALAGEGIVVLLAFSADVPLAAVIAVHAAVTLACASILFFRREQGGDLSLAFIVLLLVALAGPAGALAMLAALPFSGNLASGPQVIAAWYERLAHAGRPSPVTETFNRIASGRVHRLDARAPADFLGVIASGTLEERQRALGLIARQFHPDYSPVLDAALRSPEPVVRVQAAAVVARVREDLKAKVAELVRGEDATMAKTALINAGQLQALQGCALVAPVQQAQCRDAVRRLLRQALSRGEDLLGVVRGADRDALSAIETFLIQERRYKDLRVLRRLRGSVAGSLRRVRRRPGLSEVLP